jgi:hypothetical protein
MLGFILGFINRTRVMILGMSIATSTLVHVIISLIGIVSGLIVLFGMFGSRRLRGWTALFLLTTILTSVTGFILPSVGLTPARIFGIISLLMLAAALLAFYGFRLGGAWRWIYVGSAVLALYLNIVVLILQAFLKIPFLHALAPTGTEPPLLIAEGVLLVIFLVFGLIALISFHPERHAAA